LPLPGGGNSSKTGAAADPGAGAGAEQDQPPVRDSLAAIWSLHLVHFLCSHCWGFSPAREKGLRVF